MAPTPSTEGPLSAQEGARLLQVAAASIAHGLETGRPLPVDAAAYPPPLRDPGAAFVTLHLHGRLRGCIGSLEAYRPLVVDVAENAFAAAFRDPRFPPLQPAETVGLEVEVSVLSAPEPLPVQDEATLLARLVPGVDGLILEDGPYRATFLPTVWESLPEPREFVAQLKRKAGLPASYWSPTLRFYRYRTQKFAAPFAALRDE